MDEDLNRAPFGMAASPRAAEPLMFINDTGSRLSSQPPIGTAGVGPGRSNADF